MFRQIRCRSAHLTCRNITRAALRNNLSPILAGTGADIDHPVTLGDDVHVMFHQDHGVARIHQPVQLEQQPFHIRRMQAGCWFIQYIKRLPVLRPLQFSREFDPLGFATR